MPDIFSIGVSALQAFQTAINVTGNNIANASTPGYSDESVDLNQATPQALGSGWVGSGVDVTTVQRSFNQATANQLNASQSALGQINSVQNYSSQLDNLFSTTGDGITSALQSFYSAWSAVANDPSSSGARQALLGEAQSLTNTLQDANTQLNAASADINSRITTDVAQINSLATSIANVNQQIVANPLPSQAPNTLLDQRDQLISQLSQLTGITTTQDSNGATSVFLGNGQALVLQSHATALTTVPNQFDPTQLEVAYAGTGNNSISDKITGGDLGGLLAARTQVIDPVRSQLGQIATAVASGVNTQQSLGVDLNGQIGTALFSISAPTVSPSSNNTSTASVTAGIANIGALTGDNYVLAYDAGAYSLTDAASGATVALTGAGTAASPLTGTGLSLVVTGTPAAGDQFLIQPTANAAGSLNVQITNPSQIAAAGAIATSAATANTGTGTISSGSVLNPANANLFTAANIQFTSATTYSVNGAGSFAYTPGANITANGWQVQISGAPKVGDTFTVQQNVNGSGDNRNALAISNLQSQGILNGGTESVNDAVSALITNVGTTAQQINSAQTAQTAINTQAQQNMQSVSGVNLDEEAANLLQWQQAYQASAQTLKVASSLFTTVLDAVQAG